MTRHEAPMTTDQQRAVMRAAGRVLREQVDALRNQLRAELVVNAATLDLTPLVDALERGLGRLAAAVEALVDAEHAEADQRATLARAVAGEARTVTETEGNQ